MIIERISIKHNYIGASLLINLFALILISAGVWAHPNSVPRNIVIEAVESITLWSVLFWGTLYLDVIQGVSAFRFSYPVFAVTLWQIFIPFFDYWVKGLDFLSLSQIENTFYDGNWFQWGSSIFIIGAGYLKVFATLAPNTMVYYPNSLSSLKKKPRL